MSRLTISEDTMTSCPKRARYRFANYRLEAGVIHPTFNSAVSHLLATCLHRTLELVFLWVILHASNTGSSVTRLEEYAG